MPAFQNLYQFIAYEMRMSQVYQPVMLMELLKNDGRDTPAQQAKYIQLHKASMKPTLDKNHSIFFIHSPVSALKHKR